MSFISGTDDAQILMLEEKERKIKLELERLKKERRRSNERQSANGDNPDSHVKENRSSVKKRRHEKEFDVAGSSGSSNQNQAGAQELTRANLLAIIKKPVKNKEGESISQDLVKEYLPLLKNCEAEPDEIFKAYATPENFRWLRAPKLNDQVAEIVANSIGLTDEKISKQQRNIGIALTALLRAIDLIVINNESTNIKTVLEHLDNCCRILCHQHSTLTDNRAHLIIKQSIEHSRLRDFLSKRERDEGFLFGKDLPRIPEDVAREIKGGNFNRNYREGTFMQASSRGGGSTRRRGQEPYSRGRGHPEDIAPSNQVEPPTPSGYQYHAARM